MIDKLKTYLVKNEKAKAHQIVDQNIKSRKDLINFYEEVIPSILNAIHCEENDPECVWLEHQMSSIVRSIIEVSYKHVITFKQNLSQKKHVLIALPQEETHEMGALIGANLFELYGFKTTYIGANTPYFTLRDAVRYAKPDYVVLSVTNTYNVFTLNKVLSKLKEEFPHVILIGSGRGVKHHYDKLTLDAYIASTDDLKHFMEQEGLSCSH